MGKPQKIENRMVMGELRYKLRLTLVWSLYLTSSQMGSHCPLSFLSVRLVSRSSLHSGLWLATTTLTETVYNLEFVFSVLTVLWFLCAVTQNCFWLCCQNFQFVLPAVSEGFWIRIFLQLKGERVGNKSHCPEVWPARPKNFPLRVWG